MKSLENFLNQTLKEIYDESLEDFLVKFFGEFTKETLEESKTILGEIYDGIPNFIFYERMAGEVTRRIRRTFSERFHGGVHEVIHERFFGVSLYKFL